jgi:glyoxylase-like metal-dependent hydrolase (beta-lactamase superfamily II)
MQKTSLVVAFTLATVFVGFAPAMSAATPRTGPPPDGNDLSNTSAAPLSYKVFVSDGVQRGATDRLPNGDPIVSPPISSTLIYGATDAVLVDPPLTRDQTTLVGAWIAQSGKRLKYIYSTHGHGDHWAGTAELVKRFPGVTVYATPGTILRMHKWATDGRVKWDKELPGQIPETPVLAQPIPKNEFLLEGNVLRAIEAGHSDTDDSTVLYAPSIGLVVAGDVAYNGVHQYLVEGGNGGLEEWLKAIDRVEALNPKAVVAGHKNKNLPDTPDVLEQTRQYLLDAQKLLSSKPTPLEFYNQMIALHPDRIAPGSLWSSALVLLGKVSPQHNESPSSGKTPAGLPDGSITRID